MFSCLRPRLTARAAQAFAALIANSSALWPWHMPFLAFCTRYFTWSGFTRTSFRNSRAKMICATVASFLSTGWGQLAPWQAVCIADDGRVIMLVNKGKNSCHQRKVWQAVCSCYYAVSCLDAGKYDQGSSAQLNAWQAVCTASHAVSRCLLTDARGNSFAAAAPALMPPCMLCSLYTNCGALLGQ